MALMKNGYIGFGVFVLVSTLALSGCTVSLNYSSGSAKTALSQAQQQKAKVIVVDLMDGRVQGRPSKLPLVATQDRQQDFAGLREAVREHAVEAGLVEQGAWFPDAPTTPKEVKRILRKAKKRGAKAVLFLRLENLYGRGWQNPALAIMTALVGIGVGAIPYIVVVSLPINSEYGVAKVRAFLVDPSSRQLLRTYVSRHKLMDDSVTGWGYAPMGELQDILFEALDNAYTRAGEVVVDQDFKEYEEAEVPAMLFEPRRRR